MGLFDKVRAFKNSITGGGAAVQLIINPVQLGEKFEIIVKAQISDADIKAERVYIQIEGREEVRVDVEVDDKTTQADQKNAKKSTKTVNVTSSTFDLEVEAASVISLSANTDYEWKAYAEIPENSLPIYQGENCTHGYRARASLDCFGNDPDSGWQSIDVK